MKTIRNIAIVLALTATACASTTQFKGDHCLPGLGCIPCPLNDPHFCGMDMHTAK